MKKSMRKTFKKIRITIFCVILLNTSLIVGQHFRGHLPYPDYHSFIKTLDLGLERETFLNVEGVINFRDAGGYLNKNGDKIKEGILFRSGDLSKLTRTGIKKIHHLGIKKVYDLRTKDEISAKPDNIPDDIEYVHFPIYSKNEQPGGFLRAISRFNLKDYWDEFNIAVLAEKKARNYGELFENIASSSQEPILIHCTAGKDRVGIGIAILLLMLNVPEDTVVADYTKSNYYFPQILNYAQSKYDEHKNFIALFNLSAIDLQVFYLARENTIKKLIHHLIEKYGSIENYLIEKAGLDENTIQILKKKFIVSHVPSSKEL